MSNSQDIENKETTLRQALENPNILNGATLVYKNSIIELVRTMSFARVFEYIAKEGRWQIYDIMRDYTPEYFDHHFTRQEVLGNVDFSKYLDKIGIIFNPNEKTEHKEEAEER